jgi:hypothetical protein
LGGHDDAGRRGTRTSTADGRGDPSAAPQRTAAPQERSTAAFACGVLEIDGTALRSPWRRRTSRGCRCSGDRPQRSPRCGVRGRRPCRAPHTTRRRRHVPGGASVRPWHSPPASNALRSSGSRATC